MFGRLHALVRNDHGAQPFLLALREDRNVYRSLVFVRRDSGIRSLADLRGKRLALQTRSSTSAFYLPLITLLDGFDKAFRLAAR